MASIEKLQPKLWSLLKKGEDGKEISLLLSDGRKVKCRFEMLTYANKSDDDDTDIMVALVRYGHGGGELLAEEDIEEVI